jgi:uncharacterized phiE125 gp8 family phage protein
MSVQIRYRSWASTPIRWTSQVVAPPEIEPMTLDEVKRFARIDSDDENALLTLLLKAARDKVEQDTGVALLTQTRDLFMDRAPTVVEPFVLPFPPLQEVVSLTATHADGTTTVVDEDDYLVSDGQLSLAEDSVWPEDLRVVQPWTLRVIVGYETPEDIPPALVRAVALLAAHFAGPGRDLVIGSTGYLAAPMPMGYDACVESYTRVVLP